MGNPIQGEPQPLPTTLAHSIRLHRESTRLTQADLASVMAALGNNWTATTVSKVENEDRALSAVELVSVALALRVPLAKLLIRWDDPEAEVSLDGFVLRSSTLHDAVSEGPRQDYFSVPGEQRSWLQLASRKTDDKAAIAWVATELSRWEQAQELLRQPVTDRGRRAKEATLWAEYRTNHTDDEQEQDQ